MRCNTPGASNRADPGIMAILTPIEHISSFLVSYGCPPLLAFNVKIYFAQSHTLRYCAKYMLLWCSSGNGIFENQFPASGHLRTIRG